MSWDVLMIRTKNNNERMDDISEDMLIPFTQKEIVSKFAAIAERINVLYDCSNKSWQTMFSDYWSAEFSMGNEEETGVVLICIRGSREPTELLKELAKEFDTRLLDGSSGEFMDFDTPSCFDAYKRYSDKIKGCRKNADRQET